jgi:MFS family permease
MDAGARALRGNRDFRIVLAGQTVSALGDAISITAMPLLVLFLTGSGALMGIVGALQFLPDLVFGLMAGAMADRWDRRRMIMWADGGRAALTAAIPLSHWLGLPTMAVILIVTVPINALRLFSDAGLTSALPSLVGRDNLGRANSYIEATLSVPYVIGPAIAGLLVASIGAASTLAIDSASFAVSAMSLPFVRRRLRAEREGELPRVLDDIREGIAFVWRNLVLRGIITYWSVIAVATAGVVPALSYYITIDRDLGPALFGYVGSAWSIGYLGGSLVTGRLRGERVGLRMLATGVVIGGALIAIATTRSAPVYLCAAAVIGAALAILLVSYATLRASLTPDEFLGRVGSTARTLSLGLQPIGMLGAGALVEVAGGGAALRAMGIAAIGATLLLGLSRTVRNAGPGAATQAADRAASEAPTIVT